MCHVNFSALNHQEESVLALSQHFDGDLGHLGQTRLFAVLIGSILALKLVLHVIPVEKSCK